MYENSIDRKNHPGAESIYAKSNRNKENMGFATWKNSPDGRILKADVNPIARVSGILTHKIVPMLDAQENPCASKIACTGVFFMLF